MSRVLFASTRAAAFLLIAASSIVADVEARPGDQRPDPALSLARPMVLPSTAATIATTTTAVSTTSSTPITAVTITTTTTTMPRHLLALHRRVLSAISRGPSLPPGWRYRAWPPRYNTSRDGHVSLDGDTNVYIHPDSSDPDADLDETVAHEADHAWCLWRGGTGADAANGEPLCNGRAWSGRR